MDHRTLGMILVGVGVLMLVIGGLTMAGTLGWFGRLPGDIRYHSGNVRVYVPLVSMLLVSAVLSLVWLIVRRFS